LKGLWLLAAVCAVAGLAGCSNGESTTASGSDAHTSAEVEAALTKAGVVFLQRLDGSSVIPPEVLKELGASRPGGRFTVLMGAIPDPAGRPVDRFGIQVYVFATVSAARAAERGLSDNPDDFGALHRRFGNVFIALWDFTLSDAPKQLPPLVLHAMKQLGDGSA
jgi:hypothetical protein